MLFYDMTAGIRRGAAPLMATILLVVLAGCVTPPSQREGAVERLITRLNAGTAMERMELSALPFVLDGEIIIQERDLARLWTNLDAAGFALTGAEIVSLDYGHDALYQAFAETMDMEVYFGEYAPEDVSVARVEAAEGTFLLILGGRDRAAPVLHGIKGPLS